jgi:hypothetical protein
LNIELYEFVSHSNPCEVCGDTVDFAALSAGEKAGLLVTETETKLTLCRMNIEGNAAEFYGTVSAEGKCELYVGPRDVTMKHNLDDHDPQCADKLLIILTTMGVCQGNTGFDEVLKQRRRYPNEVIIFRGKENQEVARSEGNSIRHINCLGLAKDSGMCATCREYRPLLRKFRSRVSEEKGEETEVNMLFNDCSHLL